MASWATLNLPNWSSKPYPTPCIDCGARIGEPCIEGCPNLDPTLYIADEDGDSNG